MTDISPRYSLGTGALSKNSLTRQNIYTFCSNVNSMRCFIIYIDDAWFLLISSVSINCFVDIALFFFALVFGIRTTESQTSFQLHFTAVNWYYSQKTRATYVKNRYATTKFSIFTRSTVLKHKTAIILLFRYSEEKNHGSMTFFRSQTRNGQLWTYWFNTTHEIIHCMLHSWNELKADVLRCTL